MSDKKYKIVKRKTVTKNADLVDDVGDVIASGFEFEVTDNTRVVFPINVGSIPPSEVSTYMNAVRGHLGGVFPEGTVIFVPIRPGEDLTLYDLTPVE